MYAIALVNQKGGVGKTTTAVNLSAGLARLGKRVLLIDLDPQSHATLALGIQPRQLNTSVYSLLSGAARAREVIRPAGANLWVMPSTIELAGGEAELAARPRPQFILKEAMAEIAETEFDFAIVDSPPQLGFLNINCLTWVREVFIPVECEFYALHGLSLLMNTVERVRNQLNPSLQISAVIPTQFNPRRALTREVLKDLERHFPGRVTKTRIRVNVRLAEAPSHGKTIFDYDPECNGAKDYESLAKEVLELPPPANLPQLAVPAVVEPAMPVPAAPEPVVESVIQAPSSEVLEQAVFVPEPPAVTPEPAAMEPPVVETPQAPDPEVATPAPITPRTPVAGIAASPIGQTLSLPGLKPIVIAKRPKSEGEAADPPSGAAETDGPGLLKHKFIGMLFSKKE